MESVMSYATKDLLVALFLPTVTGISTSLSGDAKAHTRFLAGIGGGPALTGLPDQAPRYCDRAAKVAEQNPDAPYQFLISIYTRAANLVDAIVGIASKVITRGAVITVLQI
jgi:hypothetical protein